MRISSRSLLLSLAASALLIFVPLAAQATGTFVQSAQDHSGSATPRAQTAGSITVTAGNALIVWIFSLNTGAQTVTGNGNTYTYVGTSPNFSNFLSAYYVQNANSGATAVATSDTGAFAIYVQEESGMATSGGLAGGIVFNDQAAPGNGVNILTATASNVTVAPAKVFCIAVDVGGVQAATAASGTFTSGTTLAWQAVGTGRVTGWVDGTVNVTSLAEDLSVASTGNVTATVGLTGNKQFASFVTAAFALPETGAVSSRKPQTMLMGVSKLINHKPAANDSTISHKRAA